MKLSRSKSENQTEGLNISLKGLESSLTNLGANFIKHLHWYNLICIREHVYFGIDPLINQEHRILVSILFNLCAMYIQNVRWLTCSLVFCRRFNRSFWIVSIKWKYHYLTSSGPSRFVTHISLFWLFYFNLTMHYTKLIYSFLFHSYCCITLPDSKCSTQLRLEFY